MKRTKPPFRADHVGSLLRPATLREARAKRAKGEMPAADLKRLIDLAQGLGNPDDGGQADEDEQCRLGEPTEPGDLCDHPLEPS